METTHLETVVAEKDLAEHSQLPFAEHGEGESRPSRLSDPERWVDEHGDYLFKYALVRLRDAAKAEDLVQDTFLAALKGGKNFAGRSAEKTWLVGILKNKIADHFRKAGREMSFSDLSFYDDEEKNNFVAEGLSKGSWLDGHARLTGRRIQERASIMKLFGRHSESAPASCQKISIPPFVYAKLMK